MRHVMLSLAAGLLSLGTLAGSATPARANDHHRDWNHHRWEHRRHEWWEHHRVWRPDVNYYYTTPYYYAPAPTYYYPPAFGFGYQGPHVGFWIGR